MRSSMTVRRRGGPPSSHAPVTGGPSRARARSARSASTSTQNRPISGSLMRATGWTPSSSPLILTSTWARFFASRLPRSGPQPNWLQDFSLKEKPFGEFPAVPTEGIPVGNSDTVRASVYGAKTYGDLCNTRQTLGFVRLARVISELGEELINEHGLSEKYAAALTALRLLRPRPKDRIQHSGGLRSVDAVSRGAIESRSSTSLRTRRASASPMTISRLDSATGQEHGPR